MSRLRGSSSVASSAKPICIGELHLMDSSSTESLIVRRIYAGHDITIGRDQSRCQWVLTDSYLSGKHLRIYSIVYDNEEEHELEYLVYAEDLSRHGTFWNNSLIGKGSGGFLLSNDDRLRLSQQTTFRFVLPIPSTQPEHFDLEQETEMANFRKEYIVTDRLLGSGAFGKVFMAIEQNTRTQVACKLIDLRKFSHSTSRHFHEAEIPVQAATSQTLQSGEIKRWADNQRKGSKLEQRLKVFYREVEILSSLSHPNIVSIDKVFVTDNSIYIFQDLITAGDLFSYLESKNGKLLEVEAAVIIRQIILALKFLHGQNIAHRDLKPENIMMTSLSAGCRVVLTDFGAARRVGNSMRMASIVGSEQYAAPELSKLKTRGEKRLDGYTKAIDMWSVGAVTMVLLTGGSAFSEPTTGAYSPVLARNASLNLLKESKEWRQIRPRPQDFVTKLLVLKEEDRMTAQEALDHVWFSNDMHRTDFEQLYQRTIKNWYPRRSKVPIVEFVGSTFVKHLVPSQFDIGIKARSRARGTPIEPPYRPFPRNMYVALWPEKKPVGRWPMSEGVKTAITTTLTDGVRSVERRSKPHLQVEKNAKERAKNRTSEQSQSAQKCASASVHPITADLQGYVATLPLRSMSDPGPKPISALPLQRTSIPSYEDLLQTPAEVSGAGNPSCNAGEMNPRFLPGLTLTRSVNHGCVARGLSRSSNRVRKTPIIRKRPRTSLFDLTEDVESGSSILSSDDSCENSVKRRKVGQERQMLHKELNNLVVPHSPRADVDEDSAESLVDYS